jgi:endonuclease/exonuclease/phosphatase family metal-dependent hydrolase
MKPFLSFLLLCCIFISCEDDQPDYSQRTSYFKNIAESSAADSSLTVVSLNIQLGFTAKHDPWNKDIFGGTEAHIDSLASHLKSINPDIICLQEVPRNRYNTVVKDFIETLAAKLNMNYAFGAHGYNDPSGIVPVHGEWGNAIFTKFKILNIENREIEYNSDWERRSILLASILAGKDTLEVYSLHFIPTNQAVPNALTFFKQKKDKKQIIMGDFNMNFVSGLESDGYTDIFNSDSTSTLFYSIDKIFISDKYFSFGETGIISGNTGISDHPAVYCYLKMR